MRYIRNTHERRKHEHGRREQEFALRGGGGEERDGRGLIEIKVEGQKSPSDIAKKGMRSMGATMLVTSRRRRRQKHVGNYDPNCSASADESAYRHWTRFSAGSLMRGARKIPPPVAEHTRSAKGREEVKRDPIRPQKVVGIRSTSPPFLLLSPPPECQISKTQENMCQLSRALVQCVE
ncbi:hypothetical protein BOTBODRAFT_645384 [Botryobasidium botryosum FD-172 SS1]|uniref:Uncharacterized protein n=1 Tax=Botryobasidium botryosum (strain FD-172 SS1) TaxID=930990 RepID=A0A067MAH7_BOTB1|nr:hypothetical protein BOTBODRAFT_645384 [Botryobasidium botryosum FD-172 SS1]